MKRKIFTLLLVCVPLAAFLVKALPTAEQAVVTTGVTWIDVDDTGIDPNLEYPGDKDFTPGKWLDYNATNKTYEVTSGPRFGKATNRLEITSLDNITTQFYITAPNVAGSEKLKLANAGGDVFDKYEIVRYFPGMPSDPIDMVRTPQAIASGYIEGYLTPAHQSTGVVDGTDPEQLFVVTNGLGYLSLAKLKDFATYDNNAASASFTAGAAATFAPGLEGTIYSDGTDYIRLAGFEAATASNTRKFALNISGAGTIVDGPVSVADWGQPRTRLYRANNTNPRQYVVRVNNTPTYREATVVDGVVTILGGATALTPFDFNGSNRYRYFDLIGAPIFEQVQPNSTGKDLTASTYAGVPTNMTTYTFVPAVGFMKWIPGATVSPIYIRTTPITGRWLQEGDLKEICPEGAPMAYVSFTSTTDGLKGKLLAGTDVAASKEYSTFQISYQASITPSENDPVIAARTLRNSTFIDYFTLRTPEDVCKYLTVSERNAITVQWASNSSPYGALLDLEDRYLINRGLQEFAIWITDNGDYEIYPRSAVSVQHGNNGLPGYVTGVVNNQALLENCFPGRLTHVHTLPEAQSTFSYFRLGWYSGQIAGSPNSDITVIPNDLQASTPFEYLQFDMPCETRLNEVEPVKWVFMDVLGSSVKLDYMAYVNTLSATTNPTKAEAEALLGRDWVLSTNVNPATNTKVLQIIPKEIVMDNGNAADKDQYWKNPHDSVNMAAHWAFALASEFGVDLDGDGTLYDKDGYIIYNMLGDVLIYDENGGVSVQGGFLTNNAVISARIDGTNAARWYVANPDAVDSDSRFIWNSVAFDDSDRFYLALQTEDDDDPSIASELVMGYGSFGPNFANQNTHDNYIHSIVSVGRTSFCKGLLISLSDIYYVEEFAASYAGEQPNDKINTSDKEYKDGTMVQDSLSAYLYLNGVYDFKEVEKITNNLTLTSKNVTVGGTKEILAAVLGTSTDEYNLRIIPLDQTDRTARLKDLNLLPGVTVPAADYLFEEEYKWFLIQNPDGKYLVFDTINTTAGYNRAKVGFTFQDIDIVNATPVRFYQPLVGDKANRNFLIQFYSAARKYNQYSNGDWYDHICTWPNIERNQSTQLGDTQNGGRLMFAQLEAQSEYIHATTIKENGTRFHYEYRGPGITCCLDVYTTPQWMAAERLLGLPLINNVINSQRKFTDFGMSKAADGSATLTTDNKDEITHQLVGYIRTDGRFYRNGIATHDIAGFANAGSDLVVPIYTVQNSSDEYLTVHNSTDQHYPGSTANDVTGVKLAWKPKIGVNTTGYLYHTTQYFAIVDLCEDDDVPGLADNVYQRFVYLPLSSYEVNYNTGQIVKGIGNADALVYNLEIGAPEKCSVYDELIGTDITKAFRVGQFVVVDENTPFSMVVVGASGVASTNNIPVEFAWTPKKYDIDYCAYQIVKEGNIYYSVDKTTVVKPDEHKLLAHWAIEAGNKLEGETEIDPYLLKFTPEVDRMYDKYDVDDIRTQLRGSFYMVKKETPSEGADYTVIAYDLSQLNEKGNYVVTKRTFDFICTPHDLPYYDLEADGGYNIEWMELAVFEAKYIDRNIYADFDDVLAEVRNGTGNLVGYRAWNQNLKPGEEGISYLTVYRSWRRDLAPNMVDDPAKGRHIIPYYNFSVTDDQGIEYFLNVRPAQGVNESDSVRFSYLTDSEIETLLDVAADPYAMPTYKFCLPTDVHLGVKANAAQTAVYMQTLDVDLDKAVAEHNSPYILRIGTPSHTITANSFETAIYKNEQPTFIWNIYDVDFKILNPEYVTAWVFDNAVESDVEWVRLTEPVDSTVGKDNGKGGEGLGILSNADIASMPGTQFVTPSGEVVNYAATTGSLAAGTLNFVFKGRADIGKFAKREIWYYNIIDSDGNYLTDAVIHGDLMTSGNSGYWYTWNGTHNIYAYFDETKLADHAAYDGVTVESGLTYSIDADKDFHQTFGLRYVDLDKQTFYVVSRADFTNRGNPELKYRYLASVQNRYVFVDNRDDAMMFSFGQGVDGNWTGTEDLAGLTVIGGQGVINIRNAEGIANIYSIDGRLLKSVELNSADEMISVPAGIVIVKIADKASRVIVK